MSNEFSDRPFGSGNTPSTGTWAAPAQDSQGTPPHFSAAPTPQPQTSPYAGEATMPFFAPQPGIIPLRPLNLTDLFNATFKALRAAPGALFGFSFAVMSVVAVIAAATTAFLLTNPDIAYQQAIEGGLDENFAAAASALSSIGNQSIFSIAQYLATAFLAGAVAIPISQAVLGRKVPFNSVWPLLKPSFASLLGWSLLQVVLSVVFALILFSSMAALGFFVGSGEGNLIIIIAVMIIVGIVSAAAAIYVNIRLLYVTPVLVLENQPLFAAIRRSWALSSGNFWVMFGRFLVINVAVSAMSGAVTGAGSVMLIAATFFFSPEVALSAFTFFMVLLSGLFLPLSASFVTLMYLDRRIRVEGLAEVLAKAAQQ